VLSVINGHWSSKLAAIDHDRSWYRIYIVEISIWILDI